MGSAMNPKNPHPLTGRGAGSCQDEHKEAGAAPDPTEDEAAVISSPGLFIFKPRNFRSRVISSKLSGL